MTKKFIGVLFAIIALTLLSSVAVEAQRDSMTQAEIELVRDNQDIDKRIDVLTRMIDRRFAALGIAVGGWKPTENDRTKWGEEPVGTRPELLWDIRQLLQKAIDDVDVIAMHNENTVTQNKTGGLLFPKGVRSLAAAATRYLPPLESLAAAAKEEREKGLILTSIESCKAILDSVTNLPAETKPEKKKGKS